MEKLVSIVTPCYNGEKYIDRYARSLLDQDYSNCQLIFMDDGSKDCSKEKIMFFKTLFEEKGFSFEYHYHDNLGTGATIAEGVTYIKGDYFIWPDIDDTLAKSSIRKKVQFLEQYTSYGVVRTDFARIHDDSDDIIEYGAQKYPNRWKEELFEDYLLSNGVWLQPGCFMVRTSAFLDVNPSRYIYPTRRGQNWQILLPVLYKYKCGYIDEPLYNYYLHSGSMSDTSNETYEMTIRRYEMYEELILDTLEHIRMPEKVMVDYRNRVISYYLKQKIDCCFWNGERTEAKKYYKMLKKYGDSDRKITIKAWLAGSVLSHAYMKEKSRNEIGKK